MGSTPVTPIATLVIEDGNGNSSPVDHTKYGDADGITFFCPAGQTSWTVQASYDGVSWWNVVTGTTILTVTTALAVAISISPPSAPYYRVVAGATVGVRNVFVSKIWGMRYGFGR